MISCFFNYNYYVDHNNYYLYAGADLVMISKEGTVNNVNV